jgi:hypothetical protein
VSHFSQRTREMGTRRRRTIFPHRSQWSIVVAGNSEHDGAFQADEEACMKNYAPRFSLLFLVVAAAIALACGSSHNLQSISVIPATADAKDFPGGQVQFRAVGSYSSSSTPVPVRVTWSNCNVPSPSEITVSAQGLAQCNPGASGTYVVEATVPLEPEGAVCNVLLVCGQAGKDCFNTYGVAKLTCP